MEKLRLEVPEGLPAVQPLDPGGAERLLPSSLLTVRTLHCDMPPQREPGGKVFLSKYELD